MADFRRLRGFLVLGLAAALQACTVNPVTGKQDFNLLSPQQEVAIGEQQYLPAQQQQGGEYVLDPALTAYVKDVGLKLARVSDRPRLPYDFVIVNNSAINAWALPGGKIAVNRGLLLRLDDEAELAAVLGHEIVHAAAGHSAQQISRSQLLQGGLEILKAGTQNSAYGQLATVGASLGAAAFNARYGREAELESDAYGMNYMSAAGYDPYGAVRVQEMFLAMQQGHSGSALGDLFASHPPSRERVVANRARAAGLPKGAVNKSRYQQMKVRLERDKPAYELYDQALKRAAKQHYGDALRLTEQAIAKQPQEALFWVLKGDLYYLQKDPNKALPAYNRAVEANPGYFAPWLGRGLIKQQRGQNSEAVADLKRSFELLPTQIAADALEKLGYRVSQ